MVQAVSKMHLVWCIRSSVVNKWVLYANPFLRFEQESGFLSFRKPSNNVVNYGYRTLDSKSTACLSRLVGPKLAIGRTVFEMWLDL